MLDGLPLHALEEGGKGDGDVGEHKEGEGEGVEDLLGGGGADVFPLGSGGHGAHEEHEKIAVHQELGGRPQRDEHILPGQEAQHGSSGVGSDAHHSEDDGRHDGHGHVEAGEAVALGNTGEELEAVGAEDLHVAPCPAHPLAAGLAEGGGLLVIEDGVLAVADALTGDDIGDGELDVLGEEVEVPAAPLLQNPAAEEEAGAGDGAAGLQKVAGVVEEGGLPQEPQGIAGGDPVVGVVLGVAIAGDDLIAIGEGAVHLGDVVGLQEVVGVEDHKGVEHAAIVPLDMSQELVEGVALAHLYMVEALVDNGAVFPRHPGGVVGAVVGHHEDGDEVFGIVLGVDGVQEVTDDVLLIARRDQNRVAVEHGGTVGLVLFEEGNGEIDELIGVADDEQSSQGKVDDANDFNWLHDDVPL